MVPANRPIKKVVVLGAPGNIATNIVNALVAHPTQYNVTAVTGDKANFAGSAVAQSSSLPSQVTIVESDLSCESLRSIFRNKDAIVSRLIMVNVEMQKEIVDIAIECGVLRFFPNEFGMDSAHPRAPDYVPLIGQKRDLVDYLRSKEKITWTAVIIGSFFDWSLRVPGQVGWDIPNRRATIFDGGDVEFEATTVDKIGEAVAASLAPEYQATTANQYVYVNSLTTTQNEVLVALEKALNDIFTVDEASTKTLREKALERRLNNPRDIAVGPDLALASLYGQGGINQYSKDEEGNSRLWNDRLGLKNESLEEVVHKVLTECK